ncbi:DEAD-box ATP-dependent RNA helicase CshC [Nematostella vectensis]|uniref:DEAD-box ATP-dependent RNA helicase CshC n=1 Tax=Nematostella vectensis TaxID=45351 RepID=UPI0020776DFE|nr:DEAD-box ATP-dependent RNA helicase CshC [Nematostella vectensis]
MCSMKLCLFLMKGGILREIPSNHVQRSLQLVGRGKNWSHICRQMSSQSGRPKAHYNTNDDGIEGIKRGAKKRDADEEFMKLWQSTETFLKDKIRANIKGSKIPPRRPNDFRTKVLPIQSEVSREIQKSLLDDDDDVTFRVPKADEIICNPIVENIEGDQIESFQDSEISCEFSNFGVHPKLVEKLKKMGITKPVPIQEKALPSVFSHKSLLIKSETGTGKSLVFLLPSVQDPGRGYGTIIVVPTRELASQMLYEVSRLLGDKSIVASFVSGVDLSRQEKLLKDSLHPPRIVIGTPKRLWEIVQEHEHLLQRTKRIVIDEVDKTLLPVHQRSSQKKIATRLMHPRPGRLLVDKLKAVSKVKNIQLIGATATANDVLKEDLVEMGWGDHVLVAETPSYEGKQRRVPPCITHRYALFDGKTVPSKAQVLAKIYESSNQKSALVFIHRNHSVDDFVWELRYLGLNAAALYKQVAIPDPTKYHKFLRDFRTGQIQLLVGTEETVRGLDFKELDHVYLMEVPKNVEEYLHLCGRVGRQGRPGTATTVVDMNVVGEERRLRLQFRRLGVTSERISN